MTSSTASVPSNHTQSISIPDNTFANKSRPPENADKSAKKEQVKKLKQQLHVLTELLAKDPEQISLLFKCVQITFTLGEFNDALFHTNEILKKTAENVAALMLKGKILHQLKKYSESLAVYNKIADIRATISFQELPGLKNDKLEVEEPNSQAHSESSQSFDDKIFLYERGVAYFYLKQYLSAFADFDYLLDQDAMHISALGYRCATFFFLKKYELAQKEVEKVLNIDPENALALSVRGALRIRCKEFEKATDDLLKSANKDPIHPFTRFMLGKVYTLQGEFDQAIDQIYLCLDKDPNNPSAFCVLGNLTITESWDPENIQRGLLFYEKALSIDPNHAPSLCARGLILSRIGRYAEAEENLKTVLLDLELKNLAQRNLLNIYRLCRNKKREFWKLLSTINISDYIV